VFAEKAPRAASAFRRNLALISLSAMGTGTVSIWDLVGMSSCFR
jgi:hypothetical protein